ncbi:MAG TPA: ATP-binding protein [Fibrobacteria bacterium]|nr:ATP-binding protein [Fibrobacteria bacterium]HOX50185.1 ATP-binding protein [Fibrobacteria bacterium]
MIEEVRFPEQIPEALKPVFAWFESHVERLSQAYSTLESRIVELDGELEKRNAELESLLDSLHDGVLMVDTSERVTMVNGRAAQILGLDPLEAVDQSLCEIFPTQKDFTDPLLHSLQEGVPLRWVEVVWMRSAETPVPIGLSTSPVRDPSGRRLGAVASFQNLTHLKQMERELSQTRTLAALGQMAATVAHEIRNPLGGIGGFARLLQRDLSLDDPRRGLSDRIIEGVGQLNKIVTNLLAYTKPMGTQLVEVEIEPWLDDLAEWIRAEASDHDVREVTVEIEIEPRVRIARFDPEKLRQVVLNLALNALQALPGHGTIRLSARRAPGILILGVQDDGIGIPPETITEIFNPFFTTKENGTGLGLAIVRKIVELHGGNLFVESQPGSGTRFDIHLPQPIQD